MYYLVKYILVLLFFVEATRRQLSSQEIKMVGSRRTVEGLMSVGF